MDEYMAQEIYLDEAAYRQGKLALWQDYQQLQAMPVIQQAGNFADYQVCMESIGCLLGKNGNELILCRKYSIISS